jgi:hypothetical protein
MVQYSQAKKAQDVLIPSFLLCQQLQMWWVSLQFSELVHIEESVVCNTLDFKVSKVPAAIHVIIKNLTCIEGIEKDSPQRIKEQSSKIAHFV